MMNGVLITFLVGNRVFAFDKAEMGWLIGIPVLTGSIFRLPVGVLTDKYGGRIVYTGVMLLSAGACFLASYADSFWGFFFAGLGFGIAGTSFAVGIAYTSIWFPSHQQGTALGIFGAGNAGAAVTSMVAPLLLGWLTTGGTNLDGWRNLPRLYAASLLIMAVVFWLFTFSKKVDHGHELTLRERLAPLALVQVWRFGLYYFLVFGGFVALAQWLIPYYVNVYTVSVATAGFLASVFTLPSGVIRALGGWCSDRFGARTVMYWVLGGCAVASLALVVPRMDIYAPGEGIMADSPGVVTEVTPTRIEIGEAGYVLRPEPEMETFDDRTLVFPTSRYWQESAVEPGQQVERRELIARGVTHIYFQANVWIFTGLAFIVGILMGIGKAAVYKHIATYFPKDVAVVGGIVGVLGGLGGFVCPILFGYLLRGTGLWTTCWMFFFVLSVVCLVWMQVVVRRMLSAKAPSYAEHIESPHPRAGYGEEVIS
jgi:NNP family nitrate/nitrite transporter-like MFS transporter